MDPDKNIATYSIKRISQIFNTFGVLKEKDCNG
jgi:hypothetical protein